MIEIPTRKENGRTPPYARGPTYIDLPTLKELIENGSLVVGRFEVPSHWKMTDDDYLDSAPTDSERTRRKWRQDCRDKAWTAIEPLVSNSTPLSLAMRCLGHPSSIEERSIVCGVAKPTIYNYLHRYLAFGSIKNGLLPDTHRCGAPGKERKQGDKKLGRPRNSCVGKSAGSPEFTLSEKDKERLAFGYTLVSQDCTAREAFDLATGAFWADQVVVEDGSCQVKLWPVYKRPSFNQFTYWGPKMMTPDQRASRVGLARKSRATTHQGRSSQDLTVAFGQIGMLDSTLTDVYLTSRLSRLRVLPPPHRTSVLEVRSTVYLGFHVGWEAPSPNTALLAILNGALSPEEKVQIALHYGVESTVDQWPSALCRTCLTDNGELRAKEATAAEAQFNFSIAFTKTYNGPGKGDVESLHHHDHLKLDHRIPGTTRGKSRERGEVPPTDRALWNFHEYMREFIKHVLRYNNDIEVPSLAPIAMLKAGMPPTRMNIHRWLKDHGHRADIPCDVEQLRAFTLTKWPANIEHNGIFLMSEDGKRKLPLARFYNDCLLDQADFQSAKRTRLVSKATVRLDPNNLKTIWLPQSTNFIKLENVARENSHRDSLSVWELEAMLQDQKVNADRTQQQEDQASFEQTSRRHGVTQNAKAERDREIRDGKKKPSKAMLRSNLRENANCERKHHPAIHKSSPDKPEVSSTDQQVQIAEPASEAARSALRSLIDSLK